MTAIAFFNNKGGVGKTTLVYHLAWMYADLGVSVVAADLDPQANLTAMFLSEERSRNCGPTATAQTVFSAQFRRYCAGSVMFPVRTLRRSRKVLVWWWGISVCLASRHGSRRPGQTA